MNSPCPFSTLLYLVFNSSHSLFTHKTRKFHENVPWVRSRRVSSRSGHLREHNWEALPYPCQEPSPAPRHPGSPRPCHTPSAFPAAVGTPESTTVTASHPLPTVTPTRAARDRPTPGALPARCPLPPGAPGEPRPHARFQERLSDLASAARSNTRTIHPPHRDNPSCL